MNRNIELIRYMKFDDDLLLLEQVNAASAPLNGVIATDKVDGGTDSGQKQKYTTVSQYLDRADD